MSALPPTPGQTVGPFFHDALPFPGGTALVPADHPDAVVLHGRVLDGAGAPVPDALLEVWQAGPDGAAPRMGGTLARGRGEGAGDGAFTGFGRAPTDADGHYVFTTLRPAPTAPGGAAFWAVTVFARGLLDRLLTRAYLPGGPDNPDDALLTALAADDPARAATLRAVRDGERSWRFDVRLQAGPDGAPETVFLRHGTRGAGQAAH